MSNVISIFDKIKKKMKKSTNLSVQEKLDEWVKLMEKRNIKSFFVVGIADDNQVIYNCSSDDVIDALQLLGALEISKQDCLKRVSSYSP